MEDNQFDDILKEKVGEFDGVTFDPSALAAMHHKMAAVTTIPWHLRYRSNLINATLITFATLVILWFQWNGNNQLVSGAQAFATDLTNRNQFLSDQTLMLGESLSRVMNIQKRDRILNEAALTQLTRRISHLENQILQLSRPSFAQQKKGPVDDRDLLEFLIAHGLVTELGGEYYLVSGYSDLMVPPYTLMDLNGSSIPASLSLNKSGERSEEKGNIPLDVRKELDKHYRKGVGVRIGGSIDGSSVLHQQARTEGSLGLGLLADLTISPLLSIETGIKQRKISFHSSNLEDIASLSYPGINEGIGSLINVESDLQMLEIPLNLKYRRQIAPTLKFVGAVGYSHFLYTMQEFEYTYQNDQLTTPATLQSTFRDRTIRPYQGTFNIQAGMSKRLRNTHLLELNLFYQNGLGVKGIEQSEYGMAGIRGVYWLPIKE